MGYLPVISGKQLIGFLQQHEFTVIRQKGSHIIISRKDPYAQTTVPDHKELDRGTLRAILKQTGISPETCIAYFRG